MCVSVTEGGHSGDGCVLALTLCKYDLRKGFCRNSVVYNVRNGAVIELSSVVSIRGLPRH